MFPPHVSAPMFPSPCFHGVNYRIDNSTVKWIRDRNGNITYLYYNGPQRFRLVSQGFSERSSKSINSWRHDPHQPGKAPSYAYRSTCGQPTATENLPLPVKPHWHEYPPQPFPSGNDTKKTAAKAMASALVQLFSA